MKKVKVVLLFVVIVSIGFAETISAQWVPLTYKQYGITFQAPKGFKITQNDAEGFVASGANFTMEIYPWSDASITEPVEIAQSAYDEMNATDKEIVDQGPITLSGFSGHKVVGTGIQEGNVMVYALGGYLNPNNDTNFKVICTFWYDEKTYDTNYKAAEYILASFKAGK
jgi:hypothetical protein